MEEPKPKSSLSSEPGAERNWDELPYQPRRLLEADLLRLQSLVEELVGCLESGSDRDGYFKLCSKAWHARRKLAKIEAKYFAKAEAGTLLPTGDYLIR